MNQALYTISYEEAPILEGQPIGSTMRELRNMQIRFNRVLSASKFHIADCLRACPVGCMVSVGFGAGCIFVERVN